MEENNQKRLKKEVILTCMVILEMLIVCVCIVIVKINTDSKSQTKEVIKTGMVQGPATTTLPSMAPSVTQAPSMIPTITPTQAPSTPPSSSPTVTVTPSPSTNPSSDKATAKELFADSVFIGDSRTEGLQIKTNLSTARFITHRGLTVSTAMTEKVIKLKNGEKGTILDALKEGKYKKVFVMFGVNELGWPYTSTFKDKYEELIKYIKEIQPDAEIYVQSIIPVTKTKSDSSNIYNLTNIKKFNKTILAMTKDLGVNYLNVQEAVTKSGTYLPEDSAVDGVHLTKDACVKWLEYLTNHIA